MNDETRRAELRASARAARSAIGAEHASEMAERAANLALGVPELHAAGDVAAYHARDGELDPAPLARALADRGTELWWPVTVNDRIEWVRAPLERARTTGRFGIPEPTGPNERAPRLDAVIVPVVAVDRLGHRLGHGRGYYDRYFADTGRTSGVRIGYAHDVQVLERIPAAPWDAPLDMVITPTEILRVG